MHLLCKIICEICGFLCSPLLRYASLATLKPEPYSTLSQNVLVTSALGQQLDVVFHRRGILTAVLIDCFAGM